MTPRAVGRVDAASTRPGTRRALPLMLATGFVMAVSETSLGVATPSIMQHFDVDLTAAQWVTTSFIITLAIVAPLTGYVLSRLRSTAVFAVALGAFIAGTGLCASAPTLALLIAGRVLQAVGTAVIGPLIAVTIMHLVPAQRRGQALALVTLIMSVAPAIGPVTAGHAVTAFGWRSPFLLSLPLVTAALVVAWRHVPAVPTGEPRRLDPVSVAAAAVGFGGLTAAASARGIQQTLILVTALAAITMFVRRQLRLSGTARQMLDLEPFRSPRFVVSATALTAMSLTGSTAVLLPIYLQERDLTVTAAEAGALITPGGLALGLAAMAAGRLYDRRGARLPAAVGAATAAAGFGLLAGGPGGDVWFVVSHVLLSIGGGITYTVLTVEALSAVADRARAHANASTTTLTQVASAIAFAGVSAYLADRARGGGGAPADQAAALDAAMGHVVWLSAAVCLAAAVCCWLGLRARAVEAAPDGGPPPALTMERPADDARQTETAIPR